MDTQSQIDAYLASLSDQKKAEILTLHERILQISPACRLWFLDGKNDEGKTVSNPNIGYGVRSIQYANGKTREFYKIGITATTSGISVYILGLDDKKHLVQTYGHSLGKARISGYCISFKTLHDIDVPILEAAIREGFELS